MSFQHLRSNLSTAPFTITPNNSADLPKVVRGISVQAAGNLRAITFEGAEVTLPVPAGFVPGVFKKVFATGTTATGLVGYP
ncbi:spike base protein, RCAP_Rcc01079 family [Acuticoccus yangtzensis]|uniref:spike base protein, RCAP_Rcc01079 family n=1 Tax=Acuticoccus yangtzensis TaxID=1443441 RepID=UPI000ABEBF83|nr:hypothetical protein [Acuticoccus yangtzensis]